MVEIYRACIFKVWSANGPVGLEPGKIVPPPPLEEVWVARSQHL